MRKKGIKCPVCGKYEFYEEDDFDVCSVCGKMTVCKMTIPTMQVEQIR